jgi:hypothetical protein
MSDRLFSFDAKRHIRRHAIVRWPVRRILIAFLCFDSASAYISAPSPTEVPQSVALEFAADAAVRFTLLNGQLASVSGRVGKIETNLSFDGCKSLKTIRLDTIRLLRDDLRAKEAHESVTLLFDVGADESRQFGELPHVQLTFSRGELPRALITRKTSENSFFSDQICPGRSTT